MRDISQEALANYASLPKRRGDVLVFLALHGPSIVGRITKGIDAYYANTWNNVKALKKMGLIEKVGLKDQRFPEYWITPTGGAAALDLGVDPAEISRKIPLGPNETENQRLVYHLCVTVERIGRDNYRRMTKTTLVLALAKQIEEDGNEWEMIVAKTAGAVPW